MPSDDKTKVITYNDPEKLKPGVGEQLKPEYTVTNVSARERDGKGLAPQQVPENAILQGAGSRYRAQNKIEIRLAAARKNSPPSYYDAAAEQSSPVNSVTEDAIILIGAENKRRAIDYLKLFADAGGSVSGGDYNDLLLEYSDNLDANASQAAAEISNITSKFNSFKSELFSQVPSERQQDVVAGLSPLVAAMAKGLGRLGELEDRINFRKTIDSVSNTLFMNKVDDALRKELQSWVRVLASYL